MLYYYYYYYFFFVSLWRRVRSRSLFDQQKTMRISSLLSSALLSNILFLLLLLLFAYRRRCSCSLFFFLFLDQCWCSLLLTWLAGTQEENWFSFFFFFPSFFEQPMFVKQNFSIFTNRKKKKIDLFVFCCCFVLFFSKYISLIFINLQKMFTFLLSS